MKKVLVLNGPNINMLGKRQPEVYGYETLADIEQNCVNVGADLSLAVTCKQSNYEGELITWIQEAREEFDAIVMNPRDRLGYDVYINEAELDRTAGEFVALVKALQEDVNLPT